MRRRTEKIAPVIAAFLGRTPLAGKDGTLRKLANTSTDGRQLIYHGNVIAEWRRDGLYVTDAGWPTLTTRDRLNWLSDYYFTTHRREQVVDGRPWDGSWLRIKDRQGNPVPLEIQGKSGSADLQPWSEASRARRNNLFNLRARI